MIKLSKLNNQEIYINPHLIEAIEENPDTRITFITGKMMIVRESASVVLDEIVKYRRKLGINSQED